MQFIESIERAVAALFQPRPIIRLAILRILAPLVILGFMSSRFLHADDWLSSAGFRVPPLDDDWRQPLNLPPLPVWMAWSVSAALVVSGLATCVGVVTRWSSAVFAALLAYVALADRLAAFTVSKLSPVIVLALCLSPSGARASIDAWRQRRRDPAAPPPELVSGGCVSFFQLLLPVFYVSSGWSKAWGWGKPHGEWLSEPYVLWTQLHDSYQTAVSWFLANHLPAWMWTVIQGAVLAFECGAPLWFALRPTRPYALGFGVAMHLGIGLMFGPVIWFSLLMMTLLVASYAPERWLVRALTLGRGARTHNKRR
jgi:hypothetical protein